MRTYLPHKAKYAKQFGDSFYNTYKQMRYGIASCKPSVHQDLISMRKELVDWESNEDDGALSETNIQYTTWLGVTYDDVLYSKGGTGFVVTGSGNAPAIGMNYMGGEAQGNNIIQINSGGCITRINLNPAVTINQSSSFVFTQTAPATLWDIQHNLNMVPNVRCETLTGEDIEGVVEVVSSNQLKITFSQAVSGKAYLS